MRAKFVVEIRAASASAFPSNEAFVDRLLALGLGRPDQEKQPYEDRQKQYMIEAEKEWDHLPEAAEGERDSVIFFARLPDHGRLIVTRSLDGYATFRMIHDNLDELEKGTEDLVKELGKKSGAVDALHVDENKIEIYERGRNSVIIRGRVLARPFRETSRRYPTDIITSSVTGLASFVTLFVLAFGDLAPDTLPRGTFERFSTAMIASFFISVVNFVQHWGQLARKRGIEWEPASATN